jgi:hypothetical protein
MEVVQVFGLSLGDQNACYVSSKFEVALGV